MARKLRFGVQTAPQNSTWADLQAVWRVIDEAGYDTAWVFDHLYPILADQAGPCFEGWTALTALAAQTTVLPALPRGTAGRIAAPTDAMATSQSLVRNGAA